MKKVYQIPHGFLYENKEVVPFDFLVEDDSLNFSIVKLSDILSIKDEKEFITFLKAQHQRIKIIDDFKNCINPVSDEFKKLICNRIKEILTTYNFQVL